MSGHHGSVCGPRQKSAHGEAGVLAIFSLALWRGETPRLCGLGTPTRDRSTISASAWVR